MYAEPFWFSQVISAARSSNHPQHLIHIMSSGPTRPMQTGMHNAMDLCNGQLINELDVKDSRNGNLIQMNCAVAPAPTVTWLSASCYLSDYV